MTWSIRNQLMLPLVVFAVLITFLVARDRAALQVKRAGDRSVATFVAVARQLGETPAGLRDAVLRDRQAENPGWHFVVVENAAVSSTTVPLETRQRAILPALPPASEQEAGYDEMLLATEGEWYYVIPIAVPGWPPGSYLVCLEPYQSIADTITGEFRWSNSLALVASLLLIGAAAVYSGHLSRRVARIEQQVRRIAAGDLSRRADERGRDEISDLARSVNAMAADLDAMRTLVRHTERTRLHAQLAGGLAHELRNGIHSARLALEVFQDACGAHELPARAMLANAHAQLAVTETLVRRLLALGSADHRDVRPGRLAGVLADAVAMIDPIARHAEVTVRADLAGVDGSVADADALQAAFVNLALNAIEAAGRHGDVAVEAVRDGDDAEVRVSDSGPGPAAHVADTLFEPFVTTKPEGIGLGLVLVRQAVEAAGGAVTWHRRANRTTFVVRMPAPVPTAE